MCSTRLRVLSNGLWVWVCPSECVLLVALGVASVDVRWAPQGMTRVLRSSSHMEPTCLLVCDHVNLT